ncbi:hypothetical protein IQ274_23250 [Nostoc sp. LEGE 12447]|uniref:hypothetical protein n=1 Tax=Nostoc sp. LEGE 12447 TaxID=1828640 RepID=UPI00188426B3|nr:hypothetical protein [Nostoc sp. LEGE 12447]MBE9001058.1 hypothetical protein [Nostoc sp. LEGE 12447]
MNNLDVILNKALMLGSSMALDCHNSDVIEKQLIIISNTILDLHHIKGELAPTLKKLDEEIARIDAIRLTKGVVGVGLILLGQNGSDDDNILSQIASEIALEIGHDFLDEAIHDENHLREVRKIFWDLVQTIDIFIQQGTWLKEISSQCFLISDSIFDTEIQKHSQNLPSLAAQISKLSFSIRLDFSFSQPELMQDKAATAMLALERLIKIKDKLNSLSSSIDNTKKFLVSHHTINSLFLVFGAAITRIVFNNKNEIIIYIENQQYRLLDIIKECEEYEHKIINIIAPAKFLQNFIDTCLSDAGFLHILTQVQSKISIDQLHEKVSAVLITAEKRLNFDSLPVMQQNLHRMSQVQVQLRNVYRQLDIVTKKINKQANNPLNIDVIKALIGVLGKSITALGLDENGVIILYNNSQYESVKSIINKCINLKQIIEKPILQLAYLVSFGKECTQHPGLITALEEIHSNKSISDIKNDVKTKSRIIKNSLSFGNQGVMLCQLEQIKIVQKDLISINKNFQNIINTIEKGKITYIKSTTLESLLLLFGSICAVEFSPKDELFIDFNSQNEKVLDILSFCQKLQPKIETLIQEGEGKIKEAQECLKNPLLMKQCQRQQRRKSVQITTAIVASILILISPGVWFGWKRFSQEQVRWNAQTLMSSIGDVTQAKDINEIRLMRDKIKQAIASVEIIPNSFASAYLAAHQDISKFRVQLDPVEKRLQIEEDTAAKFESTKQLAMDAAILVQNPPHPATVWNEASNKWQEAITILESIPEDSFVSVDAKTKIEQYRNNYAVISARLSSEIQASDSIENAKKLSWEAVKITQNPPHSSTTWKQASNKLEQAIKLLGTMPKNSPLYAQEQQRLQEYKANYTTINKRLIIEDNAVLKFKQAQKLAKQVERIAQNTPYTLAGLQDALAKIKQATNVLSSIPSGTTVSVQASEVVQIYSRNYNTIYNRFQAINTCSSPQSSDCFDANYSFYLESIDSSLSSL